MEPRRNSMRRAHRNYSEFRNRACAGTEYPPPDYPGSGPNNITPGVPSINQSAGSSQDSSGYGPMVESASTRLGDERIPRSFYSPSTRYYDNNVHHPFRSFSQVIQRSIHDHEQPISRSGNYDTIRDTPASIKREKKCGSCRKVAKWIVIATIFVGIPFLVAVMSSQNLFFENPGISDLRESMQEMSLDQREQKESNQKAYGYMNASLIDLQNQTQSISDVRKSMQRMGMSQLQQNETIQKVLNTRNQDVEAYKYMNASLIDLQNQTQSISDLRKSMQRMGMNQLQQNETIQKVLNTRNQDVEAYKYMNASLIDLQNQTQSISDLRKSMQRMGMNQLQQNETIQKVLNTRDQDVEAYKYMNASLIDLQNQTQSLLPRVISSVKRYFDDLRKEFTTYIQQKYPGCCDNRVNITVGDCVDNCANVNNGHYHSCKTCHGFVTCSNQGIDYLDCPENLVWDDILGRCEWYSNTCRL